MISFNQHVLERGRRRRGDLAQRGPFPLSPRSWVAARCRTSSVRRSASARTQFLGGNIVNAYRLSRATRGDLPRSHRPNPGGTLDERGADWLFVRWLGDHFAATQPLAPEVTRALVLTNRTGAANVEAVTGEDFPTLVARWQMANYVDRPPGLHAVERPAAVHQLQPPGALPGKLPVRRSQALSADARQHQDRHLQPHRRAARRIGAARAHHPAGRVRRGRVQPHRRRRLDRAGQALSCPGSRSCGCGEEA